MIPSIFSTISQFFSTFLGVIEGRDGEQEISLGTVSLLLQGSLQTLVSSNTTTSHTLVETTSGSGQLIILLFGGIWGVAAVVMSIILLQDLCGKDSVHLGQQHRVVGIEQQLSASSVVSTVGNSREDEQVGTIYELKSSILRYVEHTLPTTFWKLSSIEALKMEFRKHHPLLRICWPDRTYGRPSNRLLDVLWILSLQSMSMLLLAYMFELQVTGDESCSAIKTRDLCDDEASILFDWQQPRCEWVPVSQSATGIITFGCIEARDYMSFTALLSTACFTVFVMTAMRPLLALLFGLLYAPLGESLFENTADVQDGNRSSAKSFTSVVPIGGGKESVPPLPDTETDESAVMDGIEFVRQLPSSVTSLRQQSKSQFFMAAEGCTQLTHLYHVHGSGVDRKPIQPVNSPVTSSGDPHLNSLASTMIIFLKQLNRQRKLLVTNKKSHDKMSHCSVRYFDEEWCIDPSTKRIIGLQSYASLEYSDSSAMLPGEILYREIDICQRLSRKYRRSYVTNKYLQFQKMATMHAKIPLGMTVMEQHHAKNDLSVGIELIYLFIQDLLGRDLISARLFAAKVNEDFPVFAVVKSNPMLVRGLAMFSVILINAASVYFALQFTWHQSLIWQRKYLFACIIQLAVELLYLESLEVLWVQWWIPSLIPRTALIRVHYVFEDIVEEIATRIRQHQQQQHQMQIQNQSRTGDGAVIDESLFIALNAPEFLFVSHNVAVHCPMTFESVLVRLYKTFLPGEQFSRKWKSRLDSSLLEMEGDDAATSSTEDSACCNVLFSGVLQRVVSAVKSMSWASVMVPIYWCVALLPFAVHKILLRWVVMGVSGALALSWWYAVKDHDDMFVALFAVGVLLLLLVLLFKYFSYSSGRFKGESSVPVGRPAAMFKVQASKTTAQSQVQDISGENDQEIALEKRDAVSDSGSNDESANQSKATKSKKQDSRERSTENAINKRTKKKKANHKKEIHSESDSSSGDEESGRKSNERVISKNLSNNKRRAVEENEPAIEYFQDEEDIQDDRTSLLSPTTRSRGASEVDSTGTKSRSTSRSRGRSLSGDMVRRFTRSRGRSSSYGSDVSDGVDLEEEFADFDLV